VSTIYVGGISFDTNEKALEHYFEKFGNVIETKARFGGVALASFGMFTDLETVACYTAVQ
jgi:RNA recognition motif-containing protein